MKQETKTVRVPFSGFYESIHQLAFDNFCEIESTSYTEEYNLSYYDVYNQFLEHTDWKGAREKYAKRYAEAFLDEIIPDLPDLKVSLRSPREYNFYTDTIDVDIPLEVWKEMVDKVDLNEVQTLANKLLEPRSGFVPFYSQNLEEWGDPENWETPLTEILVTVLFDQTSNYTSETFQEFFAYEVDTLELFDQFADYRKIDENLGVEE